MEPDSIPAPTPTPTVGSIVHYHGHGVPHAAIIVDIGRADEGSEIVFVELCVFDPGGIKFMTSAEFTETNEDGCWSWPPRT